MRIVSFLLAAIATLALGGMAFAGGGQIVVGQSDKPALLNPLQVPSGGRETRAIKRQIFDALVVQDNSLQPQPQLARSWRVDHETTWTFTLRDDVVFHNGEPFNSETVKFNLDMILAPDSKAAWHSQLNSMIEDVEVVGPHEIRIKTFEPAPTLLVMLAFQEMVPPAYYQEAGPEGFEAAPVGTGPFKFEKRDGSTVTLTRNEQYWGGAPKIEKLVFKTIPEVASRIAALKAGEIQIADKIPNDLSGELTGDVAPRTVTGTRVYFIGMNVDKAPFTDPATRRGFSQAVNRDLIVSALYDGNARPLNQPAFPGMFGYQDAVEGQTYDPEAARTVLASVDTPVTIDVRQVDLVLAQAVQGFLAEAGFNAEVRLVEDSAFNEMIQSGRSQAYVSSWGVAEGDLDAILSRHFWGGRDGTSRYTNYQNASLDKLFSEARGTTDQHVRNELYRKVIEILVSDAPWIALVNPSEVYGVAKNLSGWEAQSTGLYFMTTATLD